VGDAEVKCAVEIDDDTLVVAYNDETLKVWNKAHTCECIRTIPTSMVVYSMLKSKSGSYLLCGMWDGSIEVLRSKDFQRTTTIKLRHGSAYVVCVCELEDGTIVVGGLCFLDRWSLKGATVLKTYRGHSNTVLQVIELKSDVIVSSSWDKTVKIWRASTAECLHTLNQHTGAVYGLVKLPGGYFASGSKDQTLRVWNEHGTCRTTYRTDCTMTAMARLPDGSIVIGECSLMEIRKP